jgi:hypothetical protein
LRVPVRLKDGTKEMLERLRNYAASQGVVVHLIPKDYDKLISEMKSVGDITVGPFGMQETLRYKHSKVPAGMARYVNDANIATFGTVQRRTRVALYRLLKAGMLDLLEEKSHILCEQTTVKSTYVLFRRNAGDDWVLYDMKQLQKDMDKKLRLPDAVKIEAAMFRGLGAAARLLYAGANVDALGTEAALHYRMDSSVLPFFPEDLSVRKRCTFWKWSPNGSATDILRAPLHDVLRLLLKAYEFSDTEDPFLYPKAFLALQRDCVVPFVTSTHVDDAKVPTAFTGFTDEVHAKILSVFKTNPTVPYAGVARPLRYSDYEDLASKSNYCYLGCVVCLFMEAFLD